MILGVLDRNRRGSERKEQLFAALRRLGGGAGDRANVWANQDVALCSMASGPDRARPFAASDPNIRVTYEGRIHNAAEIANRLGLSHEVAGAEELLVRLYQRYGEGLLDHVNGQFGFALWDDRRHKLILARDRLGIEPLFYCDDGQKLVFASSLRALLATGWIGKRLNRQALLHYLLYCYNPGDETFWRGVYRLPAGHFLSLDHSAVCLKRYWRLSFAAARPKTESQYREEILDLMEDAIRIRLRPNQAPGVFLSGGTDSSAIVSLASRMRNEPLHTYSFRCAERSYDESPYARLVADRFGTRHTEIPFRAEHLALIGEAAAAMDEPFCDIGIEIGTYLLGRRARENVSYVLSGEGGDELFAGHPVYLADRVAAVVDRFPRVLTCPLGRLLQRIPDSDQKKNIQVKLKRFAYSLSFPAGLLSHRWRVYYTASELRQLCEPGVFDDEDIQPLLDVVSRHSGSADGPDPLSRSLYVDYKTLVDFYLRRLGLLRVFSLERDLPLLDHRLVEYAATIPSHLKIRRLSDTKYIYRRALDELLPREILHDRPKLGHSVPMKNWLRDDDKTIKWVAEVLFEGRITDTGIVRPQFVRQLMTEHKNKVHNHSHRIWALVVLVLWLRAHLDS